jgi:hypothetical protein
MGVLLGRFFDVLLARDLDGFRATALQVSPAPPRSAPAPLVFPRPARLRVRRPAARGAAPTARRPHAAWRGLVPTSERLHISTGVAPCFGLANHCRGHARRPRRGFF